MCSRVTHILRFGLLLFLGMSILYSSPLNVYASKHSGENSVELDIPELTDDLGNLWHGKWLQKLEARAKIALDDRQKLQYLQAALNHHRQRFAQLSTGRRQTLVYNIENALPLSDQMTLNHSAGQWNRSLVALQKNVVSLYQRYHQSLIQERSELVTSLKEIRFGLRGERALEGDLLVKTLLYCVQIEKRTGDTLYNRVKTIVNDRADHFLAWLQQVRRPEQKLILLIWEDWTTSGGLGYELPEVTDPDLSPYYEALKPWYRTTFLSGVAAQIPHITAAKNLFDFDTPVSSEITDIMTLMADRPRYEKALEQWKALNGSSMSGLGIDLTPASDLATMLGVDPLSGNVLSSSGNGKEDLRRKLLYRRFQQQLGKTSSENNAKIAALVEKLPYEEKRILTVTGSIFIKP